MGGRGPWHPRKRHSPSSVHKYLAENLVINASDRVAPESRKPNGFRGIYIRHFTGRQVKNMNVCAYCGTSFDGRKKKYCSNKCCREADKANKRIKYVWKRERLTECAVCGSPLLGSQVKYCSDGCSRQAEIAKRGNGQPHGLLIKTCAICGKEFSTFKSRQNTCSKECSKTFHNRLNDRRRSLFKTHSVDRDITLWRVAERDNSICQICGKPVDWSDKTSRNGRVVYGGQYPSIDHIIPIMKTGTHTWTNVQLAHRACNQRKGTKIVV